MFSRCKIVYLSIILCSVISASWSVRGSEGTFTNDWLVKIEGGPVVADTIAKKHGFINRGQINDMENWYHFVHAASPRRSRKSLTDKHQILSSESGVLHVEQQVVKSRVKRDFTLPSDPLWSAQWYLNSNSHDSKSNKDMNVQWAWEQGVTGKGVVVTILDDGLERNNPDIKDNYDAEGSYDFNSHDEDPNPRYDYSDENKHGTRCAGEVASVKNDVCGVGVAYGSSIGGVRMLDGDVTDVVEGNSLSFRSQHIDIYSSSWGPDDDGLTVDGPGTLAKNAFKNGITKGRGGLGSLFMWASGNGGMSRDSCSCDGYVISIYSIAIGSVGEHGDKPWYTEACPATLAVTYSSGGGGEQQIVTADIHNRCTRRHTGTSAAAPLAAGIVALALEVNPKLTWRDVQHVIVLTSRSEPMKSVSASDWNTNGAGHDVSHLYGFGLMDATAIVNRARHWETVPEQVKCEIQYDANHKSGNTYRVQVGQSHCSIQYLEHVQAVVSMGPNGRRGDITIDLKSPTGYTSHLLPRRSRDYHTDGFKEWPFMSVHHWGENPIGTWTLTYNSGSLHSVTLVLYGTSKKPAAVSRIPRSCDPSCLGGCAAQGSEYCDECASLQMKTSLACVDKCPEGTRQNLHMCLDCPLNCANCSDDTTCLQCHHGYIASSEGACIQSCPTQTFLNKTAGTCDLCNSTCEECSGPTGRDCTSCGSIHYSLQNGMCILNTTCPGGYYFDRLDMACEPCDVTCAECNGEGAGDCTACFPDHVLNHTICVPERSCPPGQYVDDKSCSPCIEYCKQCDNPLTCKHCVENYFLMTDKLRGGEVSHCLSTCPEKWFASVSDGLCVECHETCLTCNGPGSQNCLTCYPNGSQANNNGECEVPCDTGLYYDLLTASCEPCTEECAGCLSASECVSCKPGFYLLPNTALCSNKCTPGYYGDNTTTKCEKCDDNCKTCDGGESSNCLSCAEHMLLHNGVCVPNCPDKTFHDNINMMCGKCHASCLTCVGPKPTECLTCNNSLVLDNYRCVQDCPSGSVENDGQCEACPANCDQCSSPKHCTKCSDGHYLYEPEPEKCSKECPGGYYGENGVCKPCKSPCSECSSPDTCLSCVKNYAMQDGTCQPCCSNPNDGQDCCDCTDGSQCTSSSEVSKGTDSGQTVSSHKTAVIAILLVVMAAAFVLFIGSVTYLFYHRWGKDTSYQMLMPRSGDGLPSIGSDTEDELFPKS